MRVTAQGLEKRFGDVVAVGGVSLEIASGEFFFLLGPSGCGKTTLLRLLAGFEAPDAGQLWFGDEDVTRSAPERRGAAMVFQNYALWPHMDVEGNVAFGLDVRHVRGSERRQRTEDALARVHMGALAKRRPGALSGGQQQRVALARAMVVRPRLILLDEPLSNLDAGLRQTMRQELVELIKSSGHTAIYVTHDQKEMLAMADRCAIMRDGKVVQVGTPRELYERPASRFVAGFLGDTNLFAARVVVREADRWTVSVDGIEAPWHGVPVDGIGDSDEVYCSVRPECWSLGVAPSKADNTLTGRIMASTFLGETTQHDVSVDAGGLSRLRVTELFAPPQEPGQARLWAPASATILLPRDV